MFLIPPRYRFRALLACAALSIAGPAPAQDPMDPTATDAALARVVWSGVARLRGDHVSDLPAGRADLERVRARVRLGLSWWLDARLELGAAIELSQGSDSNRDNRRNNDNERSDAVALDRLYARWQLGERTRLSVGKDALALALSPLLWDVDLRPAGVGIDHDWALGDFDRLQFSAGYYAGQHLYDDDSRIAAAQVAWHWREGAPFSGSVLLSLLDFDRLETLTAQGLARTNRVVAGRLRSDYRLLDLQLIARTELAGWPLRARIDLARNLGADDLRDAGRFDLTLGDARQPRGWEVGYALQRIQRDAVMAAFSDDDWWFHSFARGYSLSAAYGFDERWRLRLSGFAETRDGLNESTDRLLLDLEAEW